MRIGLDATSLCRRITGMESYALNLIKALLESDHRHCFVLFFRREIHPELELYRDRAEFVLGPSSQIGSEQIWLPCLQRSRRLDLMHYPAFPPGLLTRRPFIMTIFDGTLWRDPAWLSWKARFYLAPLTRRAARRAWKVLTISDFSKSEILKFTAAKPDDVLNPGIAIHPAFRPEKDESRRRAVRKKYGLPPAYILFVGSLEPRKNLVALLEAFARLRREVPGWSRKLVLAGRKAWGAAEVVSAIGSFGLAEDVVVANYVEFGDLPAVYSMADLFVFPSLYEGFGLPPLEAMACEVPVVSSDAGSLPEALGEAAVSVNPTDGAGLAQAIRRVAEDPILRARLRQAGLERVGLFSWAAVADKVLGLYNSRG